MVIYFLDTYTYYYATPIVVTDSNFRLFYEYNLTIYGIQSIIFMSATKDGRRLVLLSEGLIPSVYIDIFSMKKY